MKSIRIKGKNVLVSQVHSWKREHREHSEPVLENPKASISRVLGDKVTSETIAKIELMGTGGETVTLYGAEAEAALEVLES